MMKQGRLGYNSSNGRYGLLSSDFWIDTGFYCGEGLEVLVDDEWVHTRMEMNLAREWYLVGTPTIALFIILAISLPSHCFISPVRCSASSNRILVHT